MKAEQLTLIQSFYFLHLVKPKNRCHSIQGALSCGIRQMEGVTKVPLHTNTLMVKGIPGFYPHFCTIYNNIQTYIFITYIMLINTYIRYKSEAIYLISEGMPELVYYKETNYFASQYSVHNAMGSGISFWPYLFELHDSNSLE